MIMSTYHELANLFIRTMAFKHAGDTEEDAGHVHTYPHAHYVSNGKIRFELDGVATDYTAPALFYVPAGVHHRLVALEDGTVGHCIHALRSQDGSGEPLDPALIPAGVSAIALADPITKFG